MHAQCPSQWNGLGVRPKTAATLRKSVEHRCDHPNHRKLLEGPKPTPKPRKLQLCGYISTQTFSDVHGLCEYLFKAERRKVRVLYDYPPQNDDELELVVGDVIEFLEEVEEGWWKGILKGRMGVFPSNFVGPVDGGNVKSDDGKVINDKDEKRKPASPKNSACQDTSGQPPTNGGLAGLKSKAFGAKDEKKVVGKVSPKNSKNDPDAPKLPPKPVRELAKVLYSYEAQNDDELSIKEGDTIVILTKEVEDKGWWKGELNGKVGVFPDNFVQLIRSEPDLLMSGHSSPQPGKPDRPDKPVKALKPDLTRDGKAAPSMMAFNPQNQPLPPLPTDSTAPTAAVKGDQASDKPVSKVSPFGPQEGLSMMNAAGIGGRPLLTSQIRRQNGAHPVSLIAAQAAERANLNNPHANGGHDSGLNSSSSSTPQGGGNGAGSTLDEGITLDSIESSEGKLKHPTADRARPPARRPPSHIGSPPGHTETIAEENGDSLVGSTSAVVHLNGHNGHSGLNNGQHEEKRTSIKDLTSKFNEANLGPVPQVINLAGKPFSNGSKLSASSLSKDDVDAKTDEGPSARSEVSQKLEAEILELRAEVKRLREHSVSKEEFNHLVSQMKTLQETMESNRAHYSKMVRDLMAEVDEEKKQRMTLQVEIDRLKKITTDLL